MIAPAAPNILTDVWPYVGFFIVRLRSVRRRDVWQYVGCVRCATQDDGEFHVYSRNLP